MGWKGKWKAVSVALSALLLLVAVPSQPADACSHCRPIIIRFMINPDGSLGEHKFHRRGGSAICDAAAMRAVEDAAPYRALPPGYLRPICVEFKFDYVTFCSHYRDSARLIDSMDDESQFPEHQHCHDARCYFCRTYCAF
jgi:hypothetical protein